VAKSASSSMAVCHPVRLQLLVLSAVLSEHGRSLSVLAACIYPLAIRGYERLTYATPGFYFMLIHSNAMRATWRLSTASSVVGKPIKSDQ